MTLENFISILVLSAAITSLGIELIKDLFQRFHIGYDAAILSAVTSFLIGCMEMAAYCITEHTELTAVTALYCACMGIANMVAATVGYDKVRAFILALFPKKN